MERSLAIEHLTNLILPVQTPHPVRVAIDGVDASGKTTLADELALPLRRAGRTVICASVDRFHNPRATRMQRGALSPEGFYLDSFNYDAFISCLLQPLGPGGSRQYRSAWFDFQQDVAVSAPIQEAPADAILLVDGIFLLRPELRGYWDFSIFVQASFETTLRRALTRDRYLFGDANRITERYQERYIPGQQLYLAQAQPARNADVTLINDNPDDVTISYSFVNPAKRPAG
jgi:uridine kinase